MPGQGTPLLRWIDRAMVAVSVLGTAYWIGFSFVTGTLRPLAVYFPLWLGGVGTLVWRRRAGLAARLRAWTAPAWARFLVLGFAGVLAEEVIAALANHLTEAVSLGLYLVRIGQFWALNLCTFFGFVVGWLLLTRLLRFSRRELFYLAGGWGLFAEKILFELPGEKLYFLLNAPPMILTYGLIITPALLSQPPTGRWRLHPMLSYPLAYMVLYAVSVPGIVVLMLLRGRYPGLFPPTSMVGS